MYQSNKRPYRILQICRLTPLWGMDLFREITHAYRDLNCEVVTVFLSGKSQPHLRHEYNGQVYFWSLNRHRPWWRLQAIWYLWKLCQKNYFDIVICHHYKPTILMHIAAKFCKVGKLFSMHHNFGNFKRWPAFHLVSRLASRWYFITVSDALKKELQALHVPSEKIITIHNAIDIERLRGTQYIQHAAREQLHLPNDKFIFGTLGRLDKVKGHEILIQAFAQLKLSNVLLVIIGKGLWEKRLKALAQQLHIAEQVSFITDVAHEGARYLRAFDVFVFPSLSEAFGLALLEAMVAELPFIASFAGGIPEAAGNKKALVPPGNPVALSQMMRQYYELDKDERYKLGIQACQYVKMHFCHEIYYKKFQQLLDK